VQGSEFDETEFFRAIAASGARALLILTKRFGGRPKDLEDIRLLEALRKEDA
jgi:indole-3-glycerol phosphate synthase